MLRHYLRCRDDTVRCVVSSLTDEGPSDLADELAKGEALQIDENTSPGIENDNWESWNPDPVDADPCKTVSIVCIVSCTNYHRLSTLIN